MLSWFLNINFTTASFTPSAPTPRPVVVSTFTPEINPAPCLPYLSSPHLRFLHPGRSYRNPQPRAVGDSTNYGIVDSDLVGRRLRSCRRENLFSSLPFALCTLRPKSVSQLFCNQLLPHSFSKHPGGMRLSNQQILNIASPASRLFATDTHSAPATPLFVTDSSKRGVGGSTIPQGFPSCPRPSRWCIHAVQWKIALPLQFPLLRCGSRT